MQNSISCIVPLYGLLKNNNLYRFSLLIDSICSAVSRIDTSLFELILINDNPDEDIEELITDILSSKNANFLWYYYVNEKNIGQGATRNKGAAFSNNNYLHFIDQDDYISENFYSEFVLNNNKILRDIYIYKPYFNIGDQNNKTIGITLLLKLIYNSSNKLSSLWGLLFSNIVYSPGQTIVLKEIVLKHGGFEILSNYGSDDYGLFYKLVFNDDLVYKYINNAYFAYRIHPYQSSKNCNMDNSVNEFLSKNHPNTLKEQIIHYLKLNNSFRMITKLMYVSLFKIGR